MNGLYLSQAGSTLSLAGICCALLAGGMELTRRYRGIHVNSTKSKLSVISISHWTTKGWVRVVLATLAVPIMLAAALVVPISNKLGDHPVRRYENVYVIAPIGEYDYWMLVNGRKTYVNFCKDFGGEPPFDKGQTISLLQVRDFVDCWSVKDIHPAYEMSRKPSGQLIREN